MSEIFGLPLPIRDPVLIVAVAMVVFLIAPWIMRLIRIPDLVGLILVGILIGPHALNLLARDQTIVLLGTVGLLYLMFLAGIEIDLYGLRRHQNRSLVFGAMTFLLPQVLGTGVGRLLGYGWATSILLASMFASHTLVAYPIAIRYGISKTPAVTTAVGGTIITDTAALLVLAIVVASTAGQLDAAFWLRLTVLLTGYTVLILAGLPRLARWYFRYAHAEPTAEYIFVLASLFAGAFLASVAGVEPIVGAFLVGLALNRMIPDDSLLNHRIRFFGEAFFIPFFLLSVGMLVDPRVVFSSVRVWQVMIAMTMTVTLTKWLAARLTANLFGYSREEGWTIFGLSVAQAAATLAATLVGLSVGLFDEAILNGAILMILVTCILGPWAVARFGRQTALQEEQRPVELGEQPERILVPISNPATANGLLDLALAIRQPASKQPLYPLTVVPVDIGRAARHVATAERMLAEAVSHLAGANVPVVPLTRMDQNFAMGISRGAYERGITTIVIGWDGRASLRRGIFGSVLDRLLEQTAQQVMVAKLAHPLNTTRRVIVLVPEAADHMPGFLESVRALKLLCSRLQAEMVGYCVGAPANRYRQPFAALRPETPLAFHTSESWDDVLDQVSRLLRPDDLVVVLGARPGAVAWQPELDRLPGVLASLVPESFVMIYPAELAARSNPDEPPPG